jgi:predicted transcriptional regulator of viral defense system
VNASEALQGLRALGTTVITTADAAAALGLRPDAASQTLRRLAAAGLVSSLRKGLWAIGAVPDAASLLEHATAPHPAYVSLQSALYLRGMIDQVPAVLYAASLGRTGQIETAVGAFSIHHLPPELFGGFDFDRATGAKLATPEKALFDLSYLSGTRSRRFRALPELELPRGFRRRRVDQWVRRIPSRRMRTLTTRRLAELIGALRATE